MKSCQVRSAAVLTADRCSMRKVCLTDRKFQKQDHYVGGLQHGINGGI